MRASHWVAALVVAAPLNLSAATPADKPDSSAAAKTFLLRYTGLTSASDVGALNLYRDDARIQIWSWQDGTAQPGHISGKDWKKQLRAGWFEGTSKLEAADFTDARVTQQGKRLVIQARRYSQTRCYWDEGYAVVIEPDAIGQYQIVEERISFQPDAICPPSTDTPRVIDGTTPAVPTAQLIRASASSVNRLSPSAEAQRPPNIVPRGQLPRMQQGIVPH